MSNTDSDTAGGTRPSFDGGVAPLLAILVLVPLIAVVNNTIQRWLFGTDASFVADSVSQIPALVLLAVVVWLVLRVEGVPLTDIGLSRRHLRPALLAIAGLVLVLNVVAAGLGLLVLDTVSVGLYPLYARVLDHTPAVMAVGAASNYLLVGPIEEFAFRGYLQNKLIDLLGGGTDSRRAVLGVVLTAAVFATVHVPNLVLQNGLAPGAVLGSVLLLGVSALLFGTVYELTGNLYLVAMLHGLGNYWLLFVDPGAWPNWGVILVLYALLVVGYRRWSPTTATVLAHPTE